MPKGATRAKRETPVWLTADEIALLESALDSHQYWQLSEDHYRSNGAVLEPGSDDDENAAEIEQCAVLQAKLQSAKP